MIRNGNVPFKPVFSMLYHWILDHSSTHLSSKHFCSIPVLLIVLQFYELRHPNMTINITVYLLLEQIDFE